jgi:hypothetical protein
MALTPPPLPCRDEWVALGDPVEVFSFDFVDPGAGLQADEAHLDLRFHTVWK